VRLYFRYGTVRISTFTQTAVYGPVSFDLGGQCMELSHALSCPHDRIGLFALLCCVVALVDVLGSVLSRFLFVLGDQARSLLSLDCRHDSFERKGRRFLLEVQVEHHVLTLFTRE
jgi:hypothetical protein